MKTASIILLILIIISIALFIILGVISKSKKTPGLIEGSLSICTDTPNCVCSEVKDHTGHYIPPINIPHKPNPTFDYLLTLKNTIREIGGHIETEDENYIASTFSSTIFRFVDDFEIRIDSDKKIIHIRSSSRVGYNDMGVNRKRVELFKITFKKNILKLSP